MAAQQGMSIRCKTTTAHIPNCLGKVFRRTQYKVSASLHTSLNAVNGANVPFRGHIGAPARLSLSLGSSPRALTSVVAAASPASRLDALIFDCDGVIVESEDIHRRAYNAAFSNFDIRCPDDTEPLVWTEEFYDELQNKVGGGKPKMRWYFGEHGWPTSSILGGKAPATDEERALLIDTLQDWKTDKYKDIIGEYLLVASRNYFSRFSFQGLV
jgi:hypothetical protein